MLATGPASKTISFISSSISYCTLLVLFDIQYNRYLSSRTFLQRLKSSISKFHLTKFGCRTAWFMWRTASLCLSPSSSAEWCCSPTFIIGEELYSVLDHIVIGLISQLSTQKLKSFCIFCKQQFIVWTAALSRIQDHFVFKLTLSSARYASLVNMTLLASLLSISPWVHLAVLGLWSPQLIWFHRWEQSWIVIKSLYTDMQRYT